MLILSFLLYLIDNARVNLVNTIFHFFFKYVCKSFFAHFSQPISGNYEVVKIRV